MITKRHTGGRNGGLRPRLTFAQQLWIAEFMAIKAEVTDAEALRLPTVKEFAHRNCVSASVVYRIAAGLPYKHPHPLDAPNYVQRETVSRANQSRPITSENRP